MNILKEPKEAFPYSAPSDDIKLKYHKIFKLDQPLKTRFCKVAFDKFFVAAATLSV
jgi:hypothetical protein